MTDQPALPFFGVRNRDHEIRVEAFRKRPVPGRAGDDYGPLHLVTDTVLLIMHGLIAVALLGAIINPAYRLSVRIPFEEMSLGWAVCSRSSCGATSWSATC